MPAAISGCCHCGAVRFELSTAPRMAVNCHCTICRKINGGAFSTYASIPESKFQILQGSDLLGGYDFSENARKHFCTKCGTPVYNINKIYPGLCMIYLGCLNDPQAIAPAANIFCQSGLSWAFSVEELESHEQGFPTPGR